MTKEELDRLVKMLENADLDPWDDDRAIEDILNLIRAWPVEESASPWISVKDRLPELGPKLWEPVLICDECGDQDVAVYAVVRWTADGRPEESPRWLGNTVGEPAFWRTLPDSPIPVPPGPHTGPA